MTLASERGVAVSPAPQMSSVEAWMRGMTPLRSSLTHLERMARMRGVALA